MKVGIFFGTNTGNTETVVEKLKDSMESNGFEIDVHDMSSASVDDFGEYENIIIASPTWNDGELQDDWDAVIDDVKGFNFAGKNLGFVGLGDQEGYPDNFLDALGTIWNAAKGSGPKLFGAWSAEGYTFDSSTAIVDGKFLGLAIDIENQDELTDDRISQWVKQIKGELGA